MTDIIPKQVLFPIIGKIRPPSIAGRSMWKYFLPFYKTKL